MGTLKQRLVVEKIVEKRRFKSKGSILKEVGYGQSMADHPKRVFESKGFIEEAKNYKNSLLKKGINGKRLAKKTEEWLEAQKPFSSHTAPDRMVPDYATQLKAGEMLREDFGLTSEIVLNQLNAINMDIEFITKDASSLTPKAT